MSNVNEIPISLIRGGTLYWVQEKFGLIGPNRWNLGRRLFIAVAVAWIPLLVLAALHGGADLRELLTDYRVSSRVLIAIPLLMIAQLGMQQHFRDMSLYFLEANLVRAEDVGQFRGIMQKALRLRDAKLPEVLVIVAVFLQIGYLMGSERMQNALWAVNQRTGALI